MKQFADFFEALDRTNKTNERIEIIKEYLSKADDKDKLWAVYLFSGGRLKKKFNTSQLSDWAIEYSKLPEWLFWESYGSVGDLAETISLLLPQEYGSSDKTLYEWIEYI